MKIIDGIKDVARKTTNSIADSAGEVTGTPKSPKELAKRLIEHLNHQEYTKIAEIITQEAKKYVARMGLDDITVVNKKLEQFENNMNNLATDFEARNYKKIVVKLKEVEKAIPEQDGKVAIVFKTIKNFLKNVIEILENYSNKGPSERGPNFNELQTIFEEYFNTLTTK